MSVLAGSAFGSPCEEPRSPDYLTHMGDARAAVAAADFEAALAHFEWARERFDFALLDYSIARAHHNLGQFADATTAYDRFLAAFDVCADPSGLRTMARAYRDEARAADGGDDSAEDGLLTPVEDVLEAPPAGDEPPEPLEAVGPDAVVAGAGSPSGAESVAGLEPGWLVVAGGAALIATGVVYDLVNADLLDARREARAANDAAAYREADADVESARTIDWVLYGVGAAALTTGVLWLVLGESHEPAPVVGVSAAPGAAVLSLGGTF